MCGSKNSKKSTGFTHVIATVVNTVVKTIISPLIAYENGYYTVLTHNALQVQFKNHFRVNTYIAHLKPPGKSCFRGALRDLETL